MRPSRHRQLALSITLTAIASAPAGAQDEATAPDEDESDYAEQGSFEIGGSIGLSWTDEVITFSASPSVGYFVVDGIELSAILTVDYTRIEDDDTGLTTSSKTGALVLEPSYHHPIGDELFVFGGLGVGVGYDGDNYELELIPRVGLNLEVGNSSVITAALRVPIRIGDSYGSDGDVGTEVGLAFEAGITTTW